MEEEYGLDEQKLAEIIAKAAREGAREGAKEAERKRGFTLRVRTMLILMAVMFVLGLALPKIISMTKKQEQFSQERPVDSYDLTLQNNGVMGYLVGDFEDAILGQRERQQKIDVLEQEVSDVATLTKTGTMNIQLFTKTQMITYKGTAYYVVDLQDVTEKSIAYDEKKKTVTLTIPSAKLDHINIPPENIEFGDVKNGILAFGNIETTAEEIAEVEKFAQMEMEAKLEEEQIVDEANRFAKLAVWEIYQPLISAIGADVKLEVVVEE